MPLLRVIQKTYKLRFVCLIGGLIGGRVFNPRQQQVVNILLIVAKRENIHDIQFYILI